MTKNNIIKLIFLAVLGYNTAAHCASAEQMHAMAANEARAIALLEQTSAAFTDLKQQAYLQKNILINMIKSKNPADEAVPQAANAEFIRANDVVKQAVLEEIKRMALMLLETLNPAIQHLAFLEKEMVQLQAEGIDPNIHAQLARVHADAKEEVEKGQAFANRTLANQADEAADLAALQAGARQALEAAQQAPNQQIGAMRREAEMHQAAANAADHARPEAAAPVEHAAAQAAEVEGAADQALIAAQAADRWQNIIQAANMAIIMENEMQLGRGAINAARNGDVDKMSKIIERDRQTIAKLQNDAIVPAEIIQHLKKTIKINKIALLFCACEHQQINIIHWLLLHAGANINGRDHLGSTCLIKAARAGHANIVELLIQAGANKTMQNNVGDTALMEAACVGHNKIVEILLQSGINNVGIDMKNIYGSTALHLAAIEGQTKITNILIKTSTNIEMQNNNGRTPLILAAKYNHPETVETLLNEGANRQAADNDGFTALHHAQEHGNWRILNLLTRK